jgi:hypothetical protein
LRASIIDALTRADLPATSPSPMGEERAPSPRSRSSDAASELSTRTTPMARFFELEDGLTTSATRTDARAQTTGVSHSSVIEATFLLDRVRSNRAIRLATNRARSALRRGVERRVASPRDPKSAPRASRPNRVEVPCSLSRGIPRLASDRAPRCRAHGGSWRRPSADRTYAPEAMPLAERRFSGLRFTPPREGRREGIEDRGAFHRRASVAFAEIALRFDRVRPPSTRCARLQRRRRATPLRPGARSASLTAPLRPA